MYNRSFIRGYASAVRLNPDEIAAEFAEYYNAPAETPAPATNPTASRPRSAAPPFALRLKLDVDPEELRRRAMRRVVLAVLDIVVVAIVAGVIAFTVGIGYWSALAVFSIAYQISVRLLSGISPAERLMARRRRKALVHQIEDATEESPVGETASTVA
jgi:hypothetical protein